MKLSCMVTKEVQDVLPKLNLTDDEAEVFMLLVKGKSAIYIADRLSMSDRTVYRIKARIQEKMKRV